MNLDPRSPYSAIVGHARFRVWRWQALVALVWAALAGVVVAVVKGFIW